MKLLSNESGVLRFKLPSGNNVRIDTNKRCGKVTPVFYATPFTIARPDIMVVGQFYQVTFVPIPTGGKS